MKHVHKTLSISSHQPGVEVVSKWITRINQSIVFTMGGLDSKGSLLAWIILRNKFGLVLELVLVLFTGGRMVPPLMSEESTSPLGTRSLREFSGVVSIELSFE